MKQKKKIYREKQEGEPQPIFRAKQNVNLSSFSTISSNLTYELNELHIYIIYSTNIILCNHQLTQQYRLPTPYFFLLFKLISSNTSIHGWI